MCDLGGVGVGCDAMRAMDGVEHRIFIDRPAGRGPQQDADRAQQKRADVFVTMTMDISCTTRLVTYYSQIRARYMYVGHIWF